MRAKTIKNKVRVNQELSPAELKSALRKAKTDLETFKAYAGLLEGEVVIWRAGGTVPPEKYAMIGNRQELPLSDTVSAISSVAMPDLAGRGGTPTIPDEEREDFLRRENDLADQLAEKERELKLISRTLEQLKGELAAATARESRMLQENKEAGSAVSDLKIRLEKAEFNGREAAITADSFKERVDELSGENDELKVSCCVLERHVASLTSCFVD